MTSTQIHPSSVVSPEAELADGVVIGPFCLVEAGARIGAGTLLRSHVVIGPHTELGENNDIYAHATLGMGPQDLKFKGAPTRLRIGDRNVVREGCTMHRGTEHGGGDRGRHHIGSRSVDHGAGRGHARCRPPAQRPCAAIPFGGRQLDDLGRVHPQRELDGQEQQDHQDRHHDHGLDDR